MFSKCNQAPKLALCFSIPLLALLMPLTFFCFPC
jgi:hypothetical protein